MNKLCATQQALAEQIAARERAEYLLQKAQATIRDLQTKAAHEAMAKDETFRQFEGSRRVSPSSRLSKPDGWQ